MAPGLEGKLKAAAGWQAIVQAASHMAVPAPEPAAPPGGRACSLATHPLGHSEKAQPVAAAAASRRRSRVGQQLVLRPPRRAGKGRHAPLRQYAALLAAAAAAQGDAALGAVTP